MKADTEKELVDLQPLFDALTEIKCNRLTPKTRAFLIEKVEHTLREMRSTAKFMRAQLEELK
jgi:hypothetical protein